MSGKLTELRLLKDLKAADMAEAVQELYPKFDKPLLSKCENGAVYGVQLRQDAMKHLYRKYAPEMARRTDGAGGRARGYQIRCRIHESERTALQRALKRNHTTIQDWMSGIIRNYIGGSTVKGLEHPSVSNALRTGYPSLAEYPHCPVCGEDCDTVYRDKWGNIAGCGECLSEADAWEVNECFPGKE